MPQKKQSRVKEEFATIDWYKLLQFDQKHIIEQMRCDYNQSRLVLFIKKKKFRLLHRKNAERK